MMINLAVHHANASRGLDFNEKLPLPSETSHSVSWDFKDSLFRFVISGPDLKEGPFGYDATFASLQLRIRKFSHFVLTTLTSPQVFPTLKCPLHFSRRKPCNSFRKQICIHRLQLAADLQLAAKLF
jgi:hypothetical protein